MPSSESAWRPVFAALANETTRRVYAEIVLGALEPGADLSPSRRRHALEALAKAGLIAEGAEGWEPGEVFAEVLASAPRSQRATGVERFLTAEGRIDRYPSRPREREELLRHVAARALEPGEVLGEAEVNERLSRFSEDTAVLRRHLVDFGFLERTASGSQYARSEAL